ncbi:hypothetical protein [Staphylococcus haemolyticus]|uniref:hypothetical protein n=1 Tax=Staphylococcus haemolyticus TaxID=1283 RepID=UPI001B7F7E3F|nr:hypothetical protein [Staphylococcus haemolyticus]
MRFPTIVIASKLNFGSDMHTVCASNRLLEYPIDLNDKIKIQESDIVEDNMNNIYVGDIISLNDAMHFMLLSSSNILANAVARYIEENYL